MDDDTKLAPEEVESFLDILRKKDVASFIGFGIQVAFREDAPIHVDATGQVVSTGGQVRGFKSDFHNPMAWPNQNGKPIKFDGSYAE